MNVKRNKQNTVITLDRPTTQITIPVSSDCLELEMTQDVLGRVYLKYSIKEVIK
jgi:hypothetical protein